MYPVPSSVKDQHRTINAIFPQFGSASQYDWPKINLIGLRYKKQRPPLKIGYGIKLIAAHGQTSYRVVALGDNIQSVIRQEMTIDEKHRGINKIPLHKPFSESVNKIATQMML